LSAELPRDSASSVCGRQRPPALAPGVPLHLVLKYETRGSLYEFLAFLGDACSSDVSPATHSLMPSSPDILPVVDEAGVIACPALFGVWTINIAGQKHVFALQRVAKLEECF